MSTVAIGVLSKGAVTVSGSPVAFAPGTIKEKCSSMIRSCTRACRLGPTSAARYFLRFAQYAFIRLDTALRAAALMPRPFCLRFDFVLG